MAITFEEFARVIDGTLCEDKEMEYGGHGVGSDIRSKRAVFYRTATIDGRTETFKLIVELIP